MKEILKTMSHLYLNEESDYSVAFLKRDSNKRCFSVNIPQFLRTPIWKNIWKRLLLVYVKIIELNYTLYTHDVTCNLSRWNIRCNDIYWRSIKTQTFWKNGFSKKCYVSFHLLLLCVFISIQAYWMEHFFNFPFEV